MNRNVYEAPASEVSDPAPTQVVRSKYINQTLLAFFLAPILTASILMVTLVGADVIFETAQLGFMSQSLLELVDQIIFVSAALYCPLVIVGLPMHWLLGKLNKRHFALYLVAGALFPTLLLVLIASDASILIFATFSGTGAFCFAMFWVLALYLPSKRLYQKVLSSWHR